MTINSDHAVLATTSGEVSTEKQDVRNVRQAEKGNEKRDNGEEETEEIEEVSNIQDDQNFQKPPLERRIKGMIWKLNNTVYGLVDASRGFYLNFSGELLERGCIKPRMDPAMFIHFDGEQDEYNREPNGVAVTHVDDIMSAGDTEFE